MRDPIAELVAGWAEGVTPRDVVILSGAGVSANPPTGLPRAAGLLRRVFDAFFEPGSLDAILHYHRELDLRATAPCSADRPVRPPRLEAVLGVAVDAYTLARATAVLDDLRRAPPNPLHAVLAAHIAAGGRQLTANFDDCIERAAPAGAAGAGDIWHFHGSLVEDPTGASLRATLRAIETGFPPDAAERLRATLRSGRRLVVVGYSGSDVFDVDPAVAELAARSLRGYEVLWVAHDASSRARKGTGPSDPQLARLLERAGAGVTVLCADTAAVLATLARVWGLTPAPVDPAPRPTPAPAVAGDDDAGRALATFRLCRQLRLHREVDRRLDDPSLDLGPEERFRARTDVLWEAGKYATARRLWRRAPEGIPRWERDERIGACLWEQGRLVPAHLWLTRSARRVAPGSPEHARIAETTARVVLRMLRSPDLRWLGRRLAPRVQARAVTVTQAAGIDAYLRARDVARQLAAGGAPAATADDARASSEWFLEAGDLAALLAYRHSYYRRTYEPATPTRELAERYRRHQRDKDLVGSAGARAMLLPGAERVYSIRELVVGLLVPTQFAPWHRLRLLAGFAARRARHRLKGRGRDRDRGPGGGGSRW